MEEAVGFEPTSRFRLTIFKTVDLSHSSTLPFKSDTPTSLKKWGEVVGETIKKQYNSNPRPLTFYDFVNDLHLDVKLSKIIIKRKGEFSVVLHDCLTHTFSISNFFD